MKVAELQALEPFETVAIYWGMVWRNWVVPYFEGWEGTGVVDKNRLNEEV